MAVVREAINDQQAILMSTYVTSVEITTLQDKGMVFRTSTSGELPAQNLAKYSVSELGYKKASIFYIDNAFGKGLSASFKKGFEQEGGSVLTEVTYSSLVDLEAYDITDKLNEVIERDPEVVFVVAERPDVKFLATKMDSVFPGKEIVVLGSEEVMQESILESKALDGMYGMLPKPLTNQGFISKYKQRTGHTPVVMATGDVYDIVYLMSLAILKVGEVNPIKISKTLSSHQEGECLSALKWNELKEKVSKKEEVCYQGISGPILFDQNGDIKKRPYQTWQLKNQIFNLIRE